MSPTYDIPPEAKGGESNVYHHTRGCAQVEKVGARVGATLGVKEDGLGVGFLVALKVG